MPLAAYVIAYIGAGIFLVAVIARVAMWTGLPIHLRWELYPVPHGSGKRARYGGSYLEEVDWWKRPHAVSRWRELRVMVPEILFLVALREHNPKLWLRSFPFHFGLYLVAGCTVLMIAGGALQVLWPALLSGHLGTSLRYATAACGMGGLVLGLLGSLGLLHRRLTDDELRGYTAPADLFNLLFFAVAFAWALVTALWVDRDFSRVGSIVRDLITLNMVAAEGARSTPRVVLPVGSVVLLSGLVAYIPLTHMSHFIGKYFAYHAIRWDDAPNLRGGPEEQAIQRQLGRRVTWAASHVRGGGTKSWGDLATEPQQAPPGAAPGVDGGKG